MRTSVATSLLAAFTLTFLSPPPVSAAETAQQAQKLKRPVTVEMDYLLFLPEGYGKEPGRKWPVIVFLHGSGERGTDLEKVKQHGPPKVVERKKDLPFVVVSPQCPPGQWWQPMQVVALVDEVLEKHSHADPDRVYLTGLSMGGTGTWETAAMFPERFAAIAPICGRIHPRRVETVKDLPTWVFHGEKDRTVPIKSSEDAVATLKRVGASEVKFARYPDADHDSWTVTYDNPELYAWFLKHTRKPAAGAGKGP